MAANESSAVASVRTLGAAEVQYFSSHPEAGFTCRLSDLVASGLIDSRLATGEKNGYAFELRGCRAADTEAKTDLRVVAYPVVRQQTGLALFVRTNPML
jgi:type IV pilus assembly protein PilA